MKYYDFYLKLLKAMTTKVVKDCKTNILKCIKAFNLAVKIAF